MELRYSFIIPVFNRPQEINELLASFQKMKFFKDFEIVIIEDGSTESSESIVDKYSSDLNISYYFKENSGPGDSRNFGMQKAKGNYFIILDSDCLLPPHYLQTIDTFLTSSFYHCFGGADAAHESFTPLQKAINYVMTSFLTTGGIRGNKRTVQNFEPRSFNMGIPTEAFQKSDRCAKIHAGEDRHLSQRILKSGYKTTFIDNAYVFHKRRISWKKFYIQVKKFGLVRPILSKWHPKSSKIAFWFPSCFVLFTIASIILAILGHWLIIVLLGLYIGLIFIDSTAKNRSPYIGALSVIALFLQFFGYGMAFLKSTFFIHGLNKDPKKQFPNLFFN